MTYEEQQADAFGSWQLAIAEMRKRLLQERAARSSLCVKPNTPTTGEAPNQ